MAVLTKIAGRDMRWCFARGGHAVVATTAVSNDSNMIEICGYPAGRRMAVITGIAAGHVGRGFAGRGDTIVARAAGADDLQVINGVRW